MSLAALAAVALLVLIFVPRLLGILFKLAFYAVILLVFGAVVAALI
jgi:hypothetical protein